MKRSFSLFISLIKNWMRSKSGVFFSILFPIMLLIIFTTVFGGQQATEYTLYVQNDDIVEGNATETSEAFIEALDSTESLNVKEVDNITEHRDESSFGSYRALRIEEGFNDSVVDKSKELRMKVTQDSMNRGGYTDENISDLMKGMVPLFRLNHTEYEEHLEEGAVNETLRKAFEENGYDIEDDAELNEENDTWYVYENGEKNYWIDIDGGEMQVFGTPESAQIVLMLSDDDQGAPIVRGTVYGVVDSFNSQMLGLNESDTTVNITEESREERGLGAVDYYLPGFIAAFIMTNGIIGVTSNISEFKRNGIMKRLTATPLKKRDWILANVGQQTVLAFGLTAVMILVAILVFGAQAYPGPYAIGLIFLGAVAFCSVGIVLGGLIKDVEAASGIGNAIGFPMMFLSGAFIPVETFPDYMQTVARLLPLYYLHQGLREIMILQEPSDALIPYLVIGVFALIFIVLAVKTTKWKDI